MSENIERENRKILIKMQQSEASIHWQRNNVFLIISSILLVALSQFADKIILITISICAFIINFSWLLIQYRSSSYIKVWKNEVKKISKELNISPIYSEEVKGIEMRIIAYILPIIFIMLWLSLLIIFLLSF